MGLIESTKRYGPRILAAISSFLFIVWGSSQVPLLSVFLEPRGLLLSVTLGVIAGVLSYMNRNRVSAFIATLLVVGGLLYHIMYFYVVKASIPVEIASSYPAIYEMLSDPLSRVLYASVAISAFIVALIIAATIKHPLELISYYISLTALLLFITPYAYLSIPLLFAALSAARVVGAKSIKGLGLFFLIYFSLLLPIHVSYIMTNYGLRESNGDPTMAVLYAIGYYSIQGNRSIPVFDKINKSEVVHGELLLSARLSELVAKFRTGSLRPKLEDFTNLPYDEVRDRLAASLVVAANRVIADYSIPLTIAMSTIWFGLGLGLAFYSYASRQIQKLILGILRRAENIIALIASTIALPLIVVVTLWIGLALGVYFFTALSPLGYESPIIIGNTLILLHGLLVILGIVYPPYVFNTFPTLLKLGEEFRKRYLSTLEALLDKVSILRGSLVKILDLAKTEQAAFKKIDLELVSLEEDLVSKFNWVRIAKSLDILRSKLEGYIGAVSDKYGMLELQLVEELRRVFNIRYTTLNEAVNIARELGAVVEIPENLAKVKPDKMMIMELIEALRELNRAANKVVEVLTNQYEEMGKSLALLDPEGEEILRSVKADVESIKSNLDYDPHVALDLALKTIVRFRDAYYERLMSLWKTLVEQLSGTIDEVEKLLSESIFIEDIIRDQLLSLVREAKNHLVVEIGDISTLSKKISGVRTSILELVEKTIDLIESESLKASKLVGVEKAIILDLSGIPANYAVEIRHTLKLITSRTGVRAFMELTELMKRSIEYLNQISIARERCANFWIARRVIDKAIIEGRCISIDELPFTKDHSRWMMKLYARIHYTDTVMELKDGVEHICPRR